MSRHLGRRSSSRLSRLRAAAGLVLLAAALLVLAVLPGARQHSVRSVALYALAAAGYGLLWTARRHLRLRWVLVVAVLVRLAMLPIVPSISDDIYRFVWDGRVQLAGFNPYEHAPDSRALDGVDYEHRDRINHPSVRTIYPPLAEGIFLGVAAAHGGMYGLKVVFGLCDVLVALILWRTVAAARRVEALSLYLLCPLVVVETWHSAHLEIVAVLFVLVAAALVERRRDLPAGLALGAAAAVKLWPAVLLVPALLGKRSRPALLLPGFVLAFALPYVPYLLTGDVLGSIRNTGARPEGGGFGFALVRLVVDYPVARVVVAGLFAAAVVVLSLRSPGRERTTAVFCWTATLLPLLMPIVQPWYWLTAVTLGLAAGLALPVALGTVAPVGYLDLSPEWRDRFWLPIVAYAPLAVALAVGARRRLRRRRAPDGSSDSAAGDFIDPVPDGASCRDSAGASRRPSGDAGGAAAPKSQWQCETGSDPDGGSPVD